MGGGSAEAASRGSTWQEPSAAPREREGIRRPDDRTRASPSVSPGLFVPWSRAGERRRCCRPLEVQRWLNLAGDALAGAVIAAVLGLPALPAVGLVLGAVAVLGLRGTRRAELAGAVGSSLGDLLGSVGVVTVFAALCAGSRERASVLEAGVLLAGAVVAVRALSRRFRRLLALRRLLPLEPVLIVGAGQVGERLARAMLEHPEHGLLPLGFVDSVADTDLILPVLAPPTRLESCVARLGVRRVVVAFGKAKELDLLPLLRASRRADLDVYVVPRLFDLGFAAAGRQADWFWGTPLVPLRRRGLSSPSWRVKRVIDLVAAAMLLVLLSPLLGLLALAVRLSSPGPVLFRQRRVGQDRRVFEVLKFRSMLVNGEADTQWSVEQDRRITTVGRWLRRLSLDELPQLLNVLRGEMSLVGPRPERPFFVERFRREIPDYDFRHRVPSGLTGWSQVHGLRGDCSIADRVRFDNQYIESWSLGRDLSILWRTLGTIARDLLSSLAALRRPRRRSPEEWLSSPE